MKSILLNILLSGTMALTGPDIYLAPDPKPTNKRLENMTPKPILTLLFILLYGLSFSQSKELTDFSQGVQLYKEAKYKEAIPFFEKSISTYRKPGAIDSLGLANCYNYIGLCHYMNLSLQKALDNYYFSRDFYAGLNSLDNTVVLLKNISLTYDKAREKNIILRSVVFDTTSLKKSIFPSPRLMYLQRIPLLSLLMKANRMDYSWAPQATCFPPMLWVINPAGRRMYF